MSVLLKTMIEAVRSKTSFLGHTVRVGRRQRARRVQIGHDLSLAGDVNFILCGDSHVELMSGFFFPEEIANGGLGGATSGVYARYLSGLRFTRRAHLSVLIIGTNDLGASDALAARTVDRFRSNVALILKMLKSRSRFVLVAALPPADPRNTGLRSGESVEVYSSELKALCAKVDCVFFDPFAFMRGERFGIAVADSFSDGLHLADYSKLAVNVRLAIKAVLQTWESGPDRRSFPERLSVYL